jgi:hypothetical protein
LTLGEIGSALGIQEYKTVGRAVQRFAAVLSRDREKRKLVKECLNELSFVETPMRAGGKDVRFAC